MSPSRIHVRHGTLVRPTRSPRRLQLRRRIRLADRRAVERLDDVALTLPDHKADRLPARTVDATSKAGDVTKLVARHLVRESPGNTGKWVNRAIERSAAKGSTTGTPNTATATTAV